MKSTRRTCDLILAAGDGNAGEVVGYQYSYSNLNVITPTNFLPVNSSWHAPIEDVIYFGMDWICPTFNKVLGDEIRKVLKKQILTLRRSVKLLTLSFLSITEKSLPRLPVSTLAPPK